MIRVVAIGIATVGIAWWVCLVIATWMWMVEGNQVALTVLQWMLIIWALICASAIIWFVIEAKDAPEYDRQDSF